jgi:aquaporin Z
MGMLLAAQLYVRVKGYRSVGCAKLHHENSKRCIFCGKPAEIRSLEALLTQELP